MGWLNSLWLSMRMAALLAVCLSVPLVAGVILSYSQLEPFALVIFLLVVPLVLVPSVIVLARLVKQILLERQYIEDKPDQLKLKEQSIRQHIVLYFDTSSVGKFWVRTLISFYLDPSDMQL